MDEGCDIMYMASIARDDRGWEHFSSEIESEATNA
jgi:hypothetical protein